MKVLHIIIIYCKSFPYSQTFLQGGRCYDNPMLFIEILHQLVCVLLCIVMCDVIRSSPFISVNVRDKEVDGTCGLRDRLRPEKLGDSTGTVELCGEKPFEFRKWTLRNPDQNPWEFACDHRSP